MFYLNDILTNTQHKTTDELKGYPLIESQWMVATCWNLGIDFFQQGKKHYLSAKEWYNNI